MALKIKLDPIERMTLATVLGETLPERKAAAAQFAREGIAEADGLNRQILGRVPPKVVTVDGRNGASLDSVNPDRGSIIVEYELVNDVLRWIGKTLVERSPVISGDYVNGHTLFVDGREIKLGGEIPFAEEYAFTNQVPYARKIEIGKTQSGRAFVVQVPNKIYERTARDARSRFGNLAKVEFTYRGIVGGRQVHPRRTSGRAHNQSALRYPTIIVRHRKG